MGCIPSTPKPTTTTTTAPTAGSANRQRRAQTPVYDPPAYIDCGTGYNRGSGGVYNGASGSTYDRSRESGTVSYAGSESGKRVGDGGD
jgi:hypothetical protein